jgi:hypothetical protein
MGLETLSRDGILTLGESNCNGINAYYMEGGETGLLVFVCKYLPVQTAKMYKGSRSLAQLTLDLSGRWG